MQTHKAEIKVESFASLLENGVNHGVFVGDADTPIDANTTWETMIDELFEMYTVPNSNAIPMDSFDDLMQHLEGINAAAEYFKTKLKDHKVFDRQAWLEANDNTFNQNNRQDFYKDIEV
jgi:hypothetical protein